MGGDRVAINIMVAPAIILVVIVAAMQSAEATTYIVGDTQGWKVPADPSFYSTWASGKVFHVNDVLEFVFSKSHTVALVSKDDYDGCVKNTTTLWSTSPASVTLKSTGDLYFLCTIDGHCGDGQKLAITVTTGSSTPQAPPTSGTSPPPPPPPKSNSAAPTSVAVAAATSLIFALVYVAGLLH